MFELKQTTNQKATYKRLQKNQSDFSVKKVQIFRVKTEPTAAYLRWDGKGSKRRLCDTAVFWWYAPRRQKIILKAFHSFRFLWLDHKEADNKWIREKNKDLLGLCKAQVQAALADVENLLIFAHADNGALLKVAGI